MAHYVDGYVLPVQRARLEEYRRMAEAIGKVWMEYGALQYWECVEEDVKRGNLTSFPQSVQLEDDEVVILAWTVFRNREERDRIMEKGANDPRVKQYMDPATWPFDGKRMFFGGFTTLIELEGKR